MASMFPTIWKNLFSRPVTRRYPYKDIREPPPGYRGKISFDNKKCDLCGDCGRVCPAKAIEVDEKIKQITYDPFKCIYCATCVQTCPELAISQDTHYTAPGKTKQSETISILS
jgi:ech hydrogenase subunit F